MRWKYGRQDYLRTVETKCSGILNIVTTNLPQVATTYATATLPILVQGSAGDAVIILQHMLNFKGFPIEIDGQFSQRTERSLKGFQRVYNLATDGIVGAKT
jgi:peptidoglycan hydrolase-like protein with peptidoglycan-binding domain